MCLLPYLLYWILTAFCSPFSHCTLHFHFHFVLGFSLPGKLDGFSQWLRRSVTFGRAQSFSFSNSERSHFNSKLIWNSMHHPSAWGLWGRPRGAAARVPSVSTAGVEIQQPDGTHCVPYRACAACAAVRRRRWGTSWRTAAVGAVVRSR